MDVNASLPLLGGLSPAEFMRRHWQKKPLLIRSAWPGVKPPLSRAGLFELAGGSGVESRLLSCFDGDWRLRHGPFVRRAIPSTKKPGWTLLVQGLDLHLQQAHEMLSRFRWVPEAQVDDLMISYATDGGGVGPHIDSYDVFLLQVHGKRRWRIGPVADGTLVDGLPVRILKHFEPAEDVVLEPGDMLYLPPLWGHDGIAVGECMTCSIGFKAARASVLARELLMRLADDLDEPDHDPMYREPAQAATDAPGRMPLALQAFAEKALKKVLADPGALQRALGGILSEPKPSVWFEPSLIGTGDEQCANAASIVLDRRSRMMYDDRHVYLNGEAFKAAGVDARLMRKLADDRRLVAGQFEKLSDGARALVDEWCRAGWLHWHGPDAANGGES